MKTTALYHLTQAPAQADERERRRSALAGVQLSKRLHEEAHERHLRARAAYADSIIAARDEGLSVAEIARAAGCSRNAIYLLMERVNGKGKR